METGRLSQISQEYSIHGINGHELENVQKAMHHPSEFVRSLFDRHSAESMAKNHHVVEMQNQSHYQVPHSRSCRKTNLPRRAVPNRHDQGDSTGYSSAIASSHTDTDDDMHSFHGTVNKCIMNDHISEPGVYVVLFEKSEWSIPEWLDSGNEGDEDRDIEHSPIISEPSIASQKTQTRSFIDQYRPYITSYVTVAKDKESEDEHGKKVKIFAYDPLLDNRRDPMRSNMQRNPFQISESSRSGDLPIDDSRSLVNAVDVLNDPETSRSTSPFQVSERQLSTNYQSNIKRKRGGYRQHSIILEQAAVYADMVDTLKSSERQFCNRIRVDPTVYLHVKETLIQHFDNHGPFRKTAAQKMFRMDVNKTAKIYDFIADNEWLQRPP